MIYNVDAAQKIAANLLSAQAVVLRPQSPFTWASGWKSPVYCDNRILLSYVNYRNQALELFIELIKNNFPGANTIAGVATAGIPHAAMLADKMQLPLIYVRSGKKAHGTGRQVEGKVQEGMKAVVVEDLISTGKSSLEAVEALREEGVEVMGVIAVFSYEFPESVKAFRNASCPLFTLSGYGALLNKAVEMDYIKAEELELLKEWKEDPAEWGTQFTSE